MSTVRDMVNAHVAPGEVLSRRLAEARGEGAALVLAMCGCLLIFVAQWPKLSRAAWLSGEGPDFDALFMGALFAWVFVMPLVLYAFAFLVYGVLRLGRRPVTPFTTRYALFWGLVAASPWFLLDGLVVGLTGEGTAGILTGLAALLALFAFWLHGLATISRGEVLA